MFRRRLHRKNHDDASALHGSVRRDALDELCVGSSKRDERDPDGVRDRQEQQQEPSGLRGERGRLMQPRNANASASVLANVRAIERHDRAVVVVRRARVRHRTSSTSRFELRNGFAKMAQTSSISRSSMRARTRRSGPIRTPSRSFAQRCHTMSSSSQQVACGRAQTQMPCSHVVLTPSRSVARRSQTLIGNRAANATWEPRRPPLSTRELHERGLNATFANYMKTWPGFVRNDG